VTWPDFLDSSAFLFGGLGRHQNACESVHDRHAANIAVKAWNIAIT